MSISMWFPWLVLVLRTAVTFIFLLLPVRGVTVPQSPPLFFKEEPPGWFPFLNSTGAVVPCSAGGSPPPTVTWRKADSGAPVTELPGLRQLRPDGSLVFPPFGVDQYRPDVHATSYRCEASNSFGIIGSRDVRVTAVVRTPLEVSVTDSVASVGGVAMLRCLVPPAAREYVSLTAWVSDDDVTVLPSTDVSSNRSRFQAFSSGLLVVNGVTRNDERRRFRCVVKDSLTGEKVESGIWGKFVVTETKGHSAPQLLEYEGRVRVREGTLAKIPCAATGNPPPNYRWYKLTGSQIHPVVLSHKVQEVDGTLLFRRASLHDSGKYVCIANNSLGQDRTDRELIVTAPLRAEIMPKRLTVRSGDDVTVNCTYAGGPVHSVHWLKDQRPLLTDHRVRQLGRLVLHVSGFRRADAGMYQCFVANDADSAQGHALLLIEEVAPALPDVFTAQVHEPGQGVSLRCTATGSPLPQVSWLVDGEPLAERRDVQRGDFVQPDGAFVVSYVNISALAVTDGGDYTCVARNEVGAARHTARLSVTGPPFIRPARNLTVVAGRPLTLTCPVVGHPIDAVHVERDGKPLPQESRHALEKPGSLVIHDARKEDQGPYRCIAVGSKGDMATRDIYVIVVTAPVISPFSFPERLQEGMRSSATCTLLDGDPPVTMGWLKDGRPDLGPDVQVVPISDFVSNLIIDKVARHHSGDYTCTAANAAASTNHTAHMFVRALPRWTIRPSDMSTVVGSSVTFDCQAEGEPHPVVRWKYAVGGELREFHSIVSSPHIHVLENGSLTIVSVLSEDKGRYLCEASNGVGPAISTTVTLTVNNSPHVSGMSRVLQARRGAEVTIQCHVTGDEPISISWGRDGSPLAPFQITKYVLKEENDERGRLSTLKIRTAERSDSVTFSCTASNPFGKDTGSSRVIVQEVPDAPEDLRVAEVTSNVVSLVWTAPYAGNSPITSYSIIYQPTLGGGRHDHDSVRRISVPGGLTTASVTNLQPVTEYQFKIIANNDLGSSAPSKPISVTTNMEAPQEAPSQVSAAALDSSSIKLSWRKPHHDHKNMQISGYYVGYKPQGTNEPFIYKTVEVDNKGVKEEFVIGGLQKNTKYVIVVQAFNGQGAGPAADEIVVKTYEYDPPRSPPLRVIATTSTSVHVRWEPAGKDSVVTGYILHYKHAASEWKEEQLHSYQTNKILDGLLCGTTYQLFLTAFNDIGRGEPSPVVEVTTEGKAPVAPPGDSFVSANMSSASVQLKAWADGGCPIRHFVVQYKPQSTRDWIVVSNHIVPEQQTLQLSDLSPGTWHDLLAVALNDAGRTEADYQFATLTLQGATVPPPSAGGSSSGSRLDDAALLVPVLCAAVVLVVIAAVASFVVVWKRRGDPLPDAASDNYARGSPGRPDDMCLSTYGKTTKGDGMHESQRESLYYPSPYATSHMAYYAGGRSAQEEGTLCRASRGAKEHTYDVPHRLKQNGTDASNEQYAQLWTSSRHPSLTGGTEDDFDDATSPVQYREETYSGNLSSRFKEGTCRKVPYDDLGEPEELSETECDRDHNLYQYNVKNFARQSSNIDGVYQWPLQG
ncbi:cell adhesion molecule Dscam1-like isoform X1 [Rhipicephalus microplus]|uniref:cell adhesion molecule Dscam1-like isoform X1 n=1 Tax=Rhipicephalus microplus TaxID=6941 RepID=UPI003F6C6194